MAEKTSRTFDKPAEHALLLFIIIIAMGWCMCAPCFKFVLFFRIFQARDNKREASEKRGTRVTGKGAFQLLSFDRPKTWKK